MRILRLQLQRYRVFEDVDLELPARVIGIFGPNGAGKSTLVESIQFALYGKARTAKQEIRTHGLLADCTVDLEFEHGGRQYRVTRTIRGKNHAIDAELFVADRQLAAGVTEVDGEIRRLLRMDHQVFRASVFAEQKQLDAFSDVTKGERKKMVLRLLGIRPIESALAAARKDSRDRKADADRLAGALPDLGELETRLSEARTERKALQAAAKEAADALRETTARDKEATKAFEASDRIREQAERFALEREGLQRESSRLVEHLEDLSTRLAEIAADLEELPALEEEASSLADVADRLDAAKRLAEAAAGAGKLEAQLAALPDADADAALAELEGAQEALTEAQGAAVRAAATEERVRAQLEQAADTLERAGELDPTAPCPTCGQELGGGFDSYVTHCKTEVKRLRAEVTAVSRDAKAAEALRKKAQGAFEKTKKHAETVRSGLDRRSSVEERLTELRARVAELGEPFGDEIPDIDALLASTARSREVARRLAELQAERKQRTRTEADLAKAQKALDACATRIEVIDVEAGKIAFDPEDHGRLRKERDEAERLLDETRDVERAAQSALAEAQSAASRIEGQLEQARESASRIGELRDDARYLERVSLLLDGFRDHLVARIGPELSREAEALFRDLTNHEYEDLKIDDDTLAIHIADSGTYFPIERFSGSEADLANLALRVAISMHLSRVSGADVGLIVLDEVLGALDAERKDLLVQTMGRLASRFHQLFVITHAEQVKDQFPASIEIRKVGRRRSEAILV